VRLLIDGELGIRAEIVADSVAPLLKKLVSDTIFPA